MPFFDRLLPWMLAALLIFTPLAFGTVEVWSIAIAELLVLFMGVIWTLRMIRDGAIEFQPTALNTPVFLLLTLMLLQMLPLPLSAIRLLSPAAYSVYIDGASALNLQMGWRTISLDPIATREEFLRVLAYVALFWILFNNFRERREIERVIVIIIGMGLFLAVLGITQLFSGGGKIYWVHVLPYGGLPFGPYVNRNHFAGYMEIAIPLTIGYLLVQAPVRKGRLTIRQRFLLWTSQQTSKSVLLMFAAIFMGAALLLTGSRGGLVSFVGSMVFFVVMATMRRASHSKGRRLALAFFGLVLIAAVWMGGNRAFLSMERLEQTFQEPTVEERSILWQDTLRMAGDYLRLGSGFNTFEEVFPTYKTSTAQMIFQYAHNDYLQLLAEGGIGAFCLVIWCLIVWYRDLFGRWLVRQDPFAGIMTLAGMTAVFAMLIHSLTDFNLHIPANAIVTVTVLAITLNAVRVISPGRAVNGQPERPSLYDNQEQN
ncbi:MAG: O-antigen ligase family protein [candidate division NC10 bacterium]|nr:O-antigen ligase family protein [candidate division NC10 bacterium]